MPHPALLLPAADTTADLAPFGVLRPLAPADAPALGAFYDGLSEQTRRFYSVPVSGTLPASEHCETIGRYDKLRFVVDAGGVILAIVEFSFDVPAADLERYAGHGWDLDLETDCRWGLCVTDAWHRRGVGTALAAESWNIAAGCGQRRVILWGGVLEENAPAIVYYRRVGFEDVGRFTTPDGAPAVDMIRVLR